MSGVGILAYGSLLEDPGVEIEPLISYRLKGVVTPFNVEFARKSSTRGGAPTVVPVEEGGVSVVGEILVLNDSVSLCQVKSLLWRRETRKEGSDKVYVEPSASNQNCVTVVVLEGFCGVERVVYAKLPQNICGITASGLAELAISSAKGHAGREGRDGISYLISLNRKNIVTPLSGAYEAEILRITGASSLDEALDFCRAM